MVRIFTCPLFADTGSGFTWRGGSTILYSTSTRNFCSHKDEVLKDQLELGVKD